MKTRSSSRRERIRAQLADLKMPGALEAVDPILSGVDGGQITAPEAIEALLGAPILVPETAGYHYVSESIPPEFMQRFEEAIADMQLGELRFDDVPVDVGWETRRRKGLEVWSIPLLSRLTGYAMEDVAMYQEIVKPAGLTYGAVMTIAVPTGEAFLGVSNSRLTEGRFDEESWAGRMQLVLPAFKAGVNAVVRLNERREALTGALDNLGQAFLLVDPAGRTLHRSTALEALLGSDAEAETIVTAMARLSDSLRRLRWSRQDHRDTAASTRASSELTTASAAYALRGSYVGRGVLGLDAAVLVSVERLTPALPPPEELIERFGLTPRQAEVALLLAQGLSDQEIAERLGISPHTARHHGEWVFSKLGIHTRKALALKLLQGSAG